MRESKALVYLQYSTTLNASLQLTQLRLTTNTGDPVDVATVEVEPGLKMSTRSRVKIVGV